MRYAARRREPNPASEPRSSRHASRSGLAYARRSNPPNGGFSTALVRPRLPRPFFGQNRLLWGSKWPPRLNFAQKTASEGAARPPATRPECPARRKTRGHLLFGVLLPGADSGPRPAPSRPGGARRDWGRACRRFAERSLNPLGIFNSPPIKIAPHATPPSHLRARRSPTSGPEKPAAPLRRTRCGRG